MASGSRARGRGQQGKGNTQRNVLRLVLPSALLAFLFASALVPVVTEPFRPLLLAFAFLTRLRVAFKRHLQEAAGAAKCTGTGTGTFTGTVTTTVTTASQELSRKQRLVAMGAKKMESAATANSTKSRVNQLLLPLPEWAPVPGTFLLGFCHLNRWSNRLLCMQRALVLASLLNRTLVLPQSDVCAQTDPEAEEGSLLIDLDHLRGCLETANRKAEGHATTNGNAVPEETVHETAVPGARVPKVVTLSELLAAYDIRFLEVDLLMCRGAQAYPAHCPPGECSAQGRVVYPRPTRPPLDLYDTSELFPASGNPGGGGSDDVSRTGLASPRMAPGLPAGAVPATLARATGRVLDSSRRLLTSSPGPGDISRRGVTTSGLSAEAVTADLARATRGARVLSLGDLFYARVAEHDPEEWERAGKFLGSLFGSPCKILLQPAPQVFFQAARYMEAAGLQSSSKSARRGGLGTRNTGLDSDTGLVSGAGLDSDRGLYGVTVPDSSTGPDRDTDTYSDTGHYSDTSLDSDTSLGSDNSTARHLHRGDLAVGHLPRSPYAAVHLRRGDFAVFCRPPRCHFWSIPEASVCLESHLGAAGIRRLFVSSDGNSTEIGELKKLLKRQGIKVFGLFEDSEGGTEQGTADEGQEQEHQGAVTVHEGEMQDQQQGQASLAVHEGGTHEQQQGQGAGTVHKSEAQEQQQGQATLTELQKREGMGFCSSPLECALVEKVVCAHATQFLWQDHSSFSAHILQLRRGLGKANSRLDRRLCALQ